ncbi:MAG: toll/interleukin-1 receptor domain-containing protein [Gammaproteobacteria bacterium]|nr:toll/interleukin-1 receptor domain-containing protein [Gammaproteobacteria bacterium]
MTVFENYMQWWEKQSLKPHALKFGLLPGDFSVTIEKEGVKIGILGLNSSFLQLTDADYKGRLALNARQFHEACGGDGPDWARQHHVCLLLTHHPSTWLTPDSQQDLQGEITAHGRFAVHLCGHMHEPVFQEIAEAGTEARCTWQGRSLFGLEFCGETKNIQRLHGYTAGKIELEGNRGKMLFWPREARIQGRQRQIVPDYSFQLNDDQHTNPRDFKLLQSVPVTSESESHIKKERQKNVFVSYAHEDNKSLSADKRKGWVTTLADALRRALTQKLGQIGGCSLWLDDAPRDNSPIPANIVEELENAAVLLIILSRAYLASKWCRQELEIFLNKAGCDSGRIFVIEREAVVHPVELSNTRNYKFLMMESAMAHTMAIPPSPDPESSLKEGAYYQKLLDLSEEMAAELSSPGMRNNASSIAASPQTVVFLAEVTDDLQKYRKEVKRYLEQKNVKVLPDALYFFPDAKQLYQAIDADLKKSMLFVQLLSNSVPHRPKGMSTPRLQHARAQLVKGLPVLQWRDPNLDLSAIIEPGQNALLDSAMVMAMQFGEFKQHIAQQLKRNRPPVKSPDKSPDNPVNSLDNLVFINATAEDMDLANKIKDFLEKNGISYSLPLENSFITKASDIRKDLEQNLLYCSAVIMLYDETPTVQVRGQLLYCHHMLGMRDRPLKVIAVCIKPSAASKPPLNIKFPYLKILECPTLQADTALPLFIQALQA